MTLQRPADRVSSVWMALFATAWLGVWMAQLTPFQLLLPAQIDELHPGADWIGSVVAFGTISGIAGVCTIVVLPLAGALSDRTRSRFGRRRPWMIVGLLLFAGSVLLLGAQTGIVAVGVLWAGASTGFCILTAALTATIADRVPVTQRGLVSGLSSAPQAIGTIIGLVLVTTVFVGPVVGYTAVAALLVVLVLPFVLLVPDSSSADPEQAHPLRPVVHRPRAGGVVREIAASMWISPRAHPDFAWTLLGRVLVNLGNALGTGLLLYFLLYGLGDADAETHLILLTLVYMVFVIVASIGGGLLSDRLGRRRPFVAVAAAAQAVAALILAVAPDLGAALVAAGFLGAGYGMFLAVDQALATQVLPDADARGKDLGVMTIAQAAPQALAPLLGAGVVAWSGGFTALFVLAASCAAGGAVVVMRVRSVR